MQNTNLKSKFRPQLLRIAACVSICFATSVHAQQSCIPVPNSKTCIDSTPCKTDSSGVQVCLSGVALPQFALSVPQTCWQYSYTYACTNPATNTCVPYQQNPACSVVSSVCEDKVPETGACDSWKYTYQCQTQPAQTAQQMSCTSGLFDSSGMPTPANTNNSFALAAVTQEILRQGQTYNQQGDNLFTGVSETCRKGYGGIKNCCKSNPGAQTNSAVSTLVFSAGAAVVKYVGKAAVNYMSEYVYDASFVLKQYTSALSSQLGFTAAESGTTTAATATAAAANNFEIGAYGFTYSTGAAASAEGTGLMGANTTIMDFGNNGFIEFNPYVFAAMVALQLLQNLASCTTDEQLLAMHKGASLSTFISETCSKSFLGSCLEHTDSYCSFNSVLAKIINIQGKTQLGLNTADCKGLSVTQIGMIDFKKIDFSEFTQAIMNTANNNLP